MKKTFTILIAAIAAILMMAQPGKAVGQTTTTQTSFDATSGTSLNGDNKISFYSYQGGAGTAPGIYNDNSIRLYQISGSNTVGGYIVIGVADDYVITSASITPNASTTAGYYVTNTSPGSTTPASSTFVETDHSCSSGNAYSVSNIAHKYIVFANFGTTNKQRLDIKTISVTYTPTHTLNYSAQDGGSITSVKFGNTTITNNTKVGQGLVLNIVAAASDGNNFAGWTATGTDYSFGDASATTTTFTMGTTDCAITANFVSAGQTTYSVTYNANGGTGTMTDGNSPYEEGDEVTLLANTFTAPTGYGFNGWTVTDGSSNPVTVNNNKFTMPASNVTVTAKWQAYTITAQSNNTNYGTVTKDGFVITGHPASGYTYATSAYTVSSGTATVEQNGNEFTVTPTSDCTVTINFAAIPTYTVTLGDNNATLTETIGGAGVTLPSRNNIGSYSFAGWSDENVTSETTTAPTIINAGTYHPTSNITLYPVYSKTVGGSTVKNLSTTIKAYAEAQNPQWSNGVQYSSISLDGNVTCTATGSSNTGKYYTNGYEWRFYQSESAYLTIATANGTLNSATITYSVANTGQFSYGNNVVTSGQSVNLSGTSVQFTVTNSENNVTNGQAKITEIVVTYTVNSSTTYYWSTPSSVETPSFTVPEGTYNTEQSVKINCATTDATIYYTTNGDDPDANSIVYESGSNISITQTTTLKAIAIKDEDSSEIASATYTLKCATPQFDAPAGNYTTDQTVAISSTTGSTIYYTTDNTDPTNESTEYTAALTIDATTTLKAIAYKSGWSPSDVATAQYNLPIVYANIAAFKEAYSSTSNELVKITGPLTTVYHNGKNLYVQDATGGMLVYDANAGTNNAIISRTYENGQTVSNIYGTYTKYNGLVEFIPSIDFPAPGEGTVVEPTDITTLSGSNYSTYESMLVRLTNATFSADATLTTSSATNVNMTASSNTVVLRNGFQRLAGSITNGDKANVVGFATIYSKNATTTYQIFPRDNNDIQYILDDMDIDDEVTINFAAIVSEDEMVTIEEGGILTVEGTLTNNGGPQGGILIDNGGQLNCPNAVEATIYKNISTAWNPSEKTGWYTIASPIGEMGFTSVGNLTPEDGEGNDTYDIYAYDEPRMTWWNSISSEVGFDPFTSFENGRGYLYRKGDTDALEFAGTINVAESYKQSLTVDASVEGLRGFALLGNPYSHNITLKHVVAEGNTLDECYVLTGEGAWTTKLTAENDDEIAPCQGFLVQATTAGDAYIHKTAQSSKGRANNDYIKFIVANSQYEDVTFALFDEGHGLNKISHRNSNIQQIYIPKDGESFAVATMDDNTQSFNLNFKAMTMGQYTLSFKTKGEFNYLHVIDRMTGEDIDMLLEGEYNFVGSPQDNEARFIVRLGYLPNYDNNGEDIFAYQNGSDIIVSGEGELQIFDVMGRMVSTQNVSGTEKISVNAQGVYVFRLIGTEIKTQKIVVR